MEPLNSIIELLSRKKMILLIIVAVTVLVIALLTYMWWPRSHNELILNPGIIRTDGVEVYGGNLTTYDGWDCLKWGIVYPGTHTNRSFYVKSKSNIDKTLIINCENWTFQDSNNQTVNVSFPNNMMNITCPQNQKTIKRAQANEPIYVTMTLKLSSTSEFISAIINNDVQTFNFDTHVYTED